MRTKIVRLLPALTAIALATSAIASASAAGKLSPAAYRAQANAICAHYNQAGAQKKVAGGVTRALVERLVAATLARLEVKASAVARLQPPDSLASGHRRVVGVLGREVAFDVQLLAQVRSAANPQAVLLSQLRPGLKLYGEELLAWASLGAKTCATGSVSVSASF